MRVPLMLSALNVPRNEGISRSISSKYEDSAGVFRDASYRISSRWRSVYNVAPVRPSMKMNFGLRM